MEAWEFYSEAEFMPWLGQFLCDLGQNLCLSF